MRLLGSLRIHVSSLPQTELEAMRRMTGQEGVNTFARIADYILEQLGHKATKPPEHRHSQSHEAAANVVPENPGETRKREKVKA